MLKLSFRPIYFSFYFFIRSMLFSFQILGYFPDNCYWFPICFFFCQRIYFVWFEPLLWLASPPRIWSVLKMLWMHMKTMCIMLLLGGVLYQGQLSQDVWQCFSSLLILLIFCLHVLTINGGVEYPQLLGWPKTSFRFFHTMLKNPNEIFGQHDIFVGWLFLCVVYSLSSHI